MADNIRLGTAKFMTISEPLATRIQASEQPRLLSREVKSKLFETVIPFSEQSKKEAAELLKRVHDLSAGALDGTFELKSDDVDEIPVRLFHPRGPQAKEFDSSTQDDEAVDSYVAASYCWQKPQDSCTQIESLGEWQSMN
jgi:hypothetical protein